MYNIMHVLVGLILQFKDIFRDNIKCPTCDYYLSKPVL